MTVKIIIKKTSFLIASFALICFSFGCKKNPSISFSFRSVDGWYSQEFFQISNIKYYDDSGMLSFKIKDCDINRFAEYTNENRGKNIDFLFGGMMIGNIKFECSIKDGCFSGHLLDGKIPSDEIIKKIKPCR